MKDKESKSLHGLTRSLLSNMITGVSEGYTKQLEMVGVGYRAEQKGKAINLSVMKSHQDVIEAPEGIEIKVEDNTKISVSGIDKQPSSNLESSSENQTISGFMSVIGLFSPSSEQSITTTLFNIPTCGAARPTPEYLYMVSIISKQSFLILSSILVTWVHTFFNRGSGCSNILNSVI